MKQKQKINYTIFYTVNLHRIYSKHVDIFNQKCNELAAKMISYYKKNDKQIDISTDFFENGVKDLFEL